MTLNIGPKKKIASICAHCGGRRVGMKKYLNPFTGKMDYFHKLCHRGLVARFNYQQAQKEAEEAGERLREDDNR